MGLVQPRKMKLQNQTFLDVLHSATNHELNGALSLLAIPASSSASEEEAVHFWRACGVRTVHSRGSRSRSRKKPLSAKSAAK